MGQSPKRDLFKRRAVVLKKLGAIDYDLRKSPTEYQKRRVRELTVKHEDVLKHPDNFTVKVVSSETAKSIDVYTAKIKTKSGKVKIFIPNPDGKKVKVNRDHSITFGQDGDKIIRRVYPGGKDIFKTAEKLFKKFPQFSDDEIDWSESPENNPAYKNYLMVNINGKANFSKLTAFNMADFTGYMSSWQPKDGDKMDPDDRAALRERLISHMNIVSVKEPDGYFKPHNSGVKSAEKKTRTKKNRGH